MWLINPAKNELGRLSKFIIQAANKELRHKLNINQWKNTEEVIDWFKSIKDKQHCKFVIFEIKDFYPSIKERLPIQFLDFAEKYIKVNSEGQSHHQTFEKVSAFQQTTNLDQKRKWII